MDDDRDESIEPMEKYHWNNWVSQNWRDYCVFNREKPGVDSRDAYLVFIRFAYWKEQSVIRREDGVDGRVSVTKYEERLLQGG